MSRLAWGQIPELLPNRRSSSSIRVWTFLRDAKNSLWLQARSDSSKPWLPVTDRNWLHLMLLQQGKIFLKSTYARWIGHMGSNIPWGCVLDFLRYGYFERDEGVSLSYM